MIQPPENLNMGHAIAYVLLYTAKYNDGESKPNEFHEILKSMHYWMGQDTNPEEIKKLLIETDEWFSSGSNFEKTDMLDKVIAMIKGNSGDNNSVIKEIFEDCVRICASNNDNYKSFIDNNTLLEDDVLKSICEEYPILLNLMNKMS
mgnify:FL=1|jgi:hypothetical protein